jgi:penicillin-binding protein 1A
VWFCGFTPDYTTVVWMGYRDNHPLGQGKRVTGGALACPVWTQFMLKAEEGLPVRDFERPYGVNMRMVDKQSGVAGGSFEEAFVAGTEPPAIFQVYPLYRHESDLEREALTDVSTINAL